MENKVIQERLGSLRETMQNAGMDYYLIPTADYHNSEYVSDYFKNTYNILRHWVSLIYYQYSFFYVFINGLIT